MVKSDNIDMTGPVPEWVYKQTWTAADPLTVEEPWAWTCGDCGETMARDAISAHCAAHATAPARGALLGMVLGALCWVAIAVLAWRMLR